jgi:hypothetical protein
MAQDGQVGGPRYDPTPRNSPMTTLAVAMDIYSRLYKFRETASVSPVENFLTEALADIFNRLPMPIRTELLVRMLPASCSSRLQNKIMSQVRAISAPPPRTPPFSAARVGTGMFSITSESEIFLSLLPITGVSLPAVANFELLLRSALWFLDHVTWWLAVDRFRSVTMRDTVSVPIIVDAATRARWTEGRPGRPCVILQRSPS